MSLKRVSIYLGKRKTKLRSRVVMEKFIGRELGSNEVVHHINGDSLDDRIENLQLMSRSEHTSFHLLRDREYFKGPKSLAWNKRVTNEKVYRLAVLGYSYREIAKELNVRSHHTISRRVALMTDGQKEVIESSKRKRLHSKFKGVTWHIGRNKWYAVLSTSKGQKHLGVFESELDAAKAYEKAVG